MSKLVESKTKKNYTMRNIALYNHKQLLIKKLNFFRQELAISADSTQKFELKYRIQELEKELNEISTQEEPQTEKENQQVEHLFELQKEIENLKTEFLKLTKQHTEVEKEYTVFVDKIKNNRQISTTEILQNKSFIDLKTDTLEHFFKSTRVLQYFAENNINAADLSIQEKLRAFSLAENGHLYKGTFLCLCEGYQIRGVCQSAIDSKFAVFKGTERINILVVETVTGNIIEQFEKMMRLLQTHIPIYRNTEESKDYYQIPLIAFKELTANAFIHRSYEPQIRSTIQIELFDDRLEIKSPGLFPSSFSSSIKEGKINHSLLVNPTIASIFYLFEHIERLGTGINKAQNAVKKQGFPPIVFTQENEYTCATIFRYEELSYSNIVKSDLQLIEDEKIMELFDIIEACGIDEKLIEKLKFEYIADGLTKSLKERLKLLVKNLPK